MNYSKTTPETLAKEVVNNIGREVHYASIPTDGAQKAAKIISEFLAQV